MKKLIFLSLLLILSISCSEDVNPQPYTYTKIFTGEVKKTWKVTFLEETLDGEIVDTFTIACSLDDRYVFYNDSEHGFEAVTGSDKCYNPSEASIISDTWSFTNASATLMMVLPFLTPDFSLPFIVREVEKNKMELEIFFDDNRGSYRIHFDVTDED